MILYCVPDSLDMLYWGLGEKLGVLLVFVLLCEDHRLNDKSVTHSVTVEIS